MANEIAKLTADLNIIAKLDDEPNDVGGLSAAELKAEFDKAGITIQKYINETLLPNVDEISDSFMLVRVTGEAPDLVADKTAKEINDFARAGGLPVMVTGGTASALYYNPAKSPTLAPFVAIMGQTAPGEREGTMQTIVLAVKMNKTVAVKLYDHNTSAKAHMDIRALIVENQEAIKGLSDAITVANGNVVVADCFDAAEPSTSAPNTWYVPKTSPRPSGEAGMTIDVRWQHGRVDGLGYDVSLIWGAPDGSDNETVVSAASVSTGLSGTYSIPTEGTVRYQLIEQSGRLRWHYVSGKLLPRQFSSATAAATADKSVPGMEVEYLPGMEIYVQMDNGNTADVMRLVPDSGPTLPVYGNGKGAKTGEIPAGYILHLINSGDHWQIINGGSGGGVTPDQLNEPRHTTLVVHAFTHGIGYKADVKASLIKRHYDGGGIVLLNFDAPDGTGEQSYRYETYKDYRDGRGAVAVFRRPVVDVAGKVVKRIVIKIDEKENVYQEEESLDVPQIDDKAPGADTTYSGEKVDQLLTQKVGKNQLDLIFTVDGKLHITVDGAPVGIGVEIGGPVPPTPVYGDPTTDKQTIKMGKESSTELGVKLSQKPNVNQTVSVSSSSPLLTVNRDLLQFTPDNWDTYQYVALTTGVFTDDQTVNVVLRNSDPLQTESMVPVTLQGQAFPVDMTIPPDKHVLTADDFTANEPYGGDAIRWYGYKGTYKNIVIPSKINGKTVWVTPCGGGSQQSFPQSTGIQYVTFEDGVIFRPGGQTNGMSADWAFKDHTALIGVSNMPTAITGIYQGFSGCSSLKFIDNIGDMVNIEKFESAFEGTTALEYMQDLSAITGVTGIKNMFKNSGIKKVYGIPTGSVTDFMGVFSGTKNLQTAEIPASATSLRYAFTGCAALREVKIYAGNVTNVQAAFDGCKDLTIYCPAGSATMQNISAAYGSRPDITIKDLSGAAKPNLVTWGDSVTSPGRAWKEWPSRLIEKTPGFELKNVAVSGEYTTSTSARQGGNAISTQGVTIPAEETPVEMTLTTKDGQVFSNSPVFSAGGGFNACTVKGVSGVIARSGHTTYTFTRSTPGEAVEIKDNTIVTSNADDILNNPEAVMLINMGNNAGWDLKPAVLLNQAQLMVDHFKAKGGTKYIISGPFTGQHLDTPEVIAIVKEYEEQAATAFGSNWLNLREYMINQGLADNGLVATESDTARMAIGQIPGSLLGGGSTENIPSYPETSNDRAHPNAYGQNAICLAYYGKGKELGYWT